MSPLLALEVSVGLPSRPVGVPETASSRSEASGSIRRIVRNPLVFKG